MISPGDLDLFLVTDDAAGGGAADSRLHEAGRAAGSDAARAGVNLTRRMPMYKVTRLENGLTVATAEMPHMASVSVGIWVGRGRPP